jgi:transporter family protein
MAWFFIALIPPFFWSFANFFDKILLSKYFKGSQVGALVLFSGLVEIFLVPIFYLIDPNILAGGLQNILILLLSGFLIILFYIPYLYAIDADETSIVAPLFQLIPVFTYFMGIIFLDETLKPLQVAASILIISGAILLSLEKQEKIIFKTKVFLLMALASVIFSLNITLFKFVATKTNFWVTSFWEYLGTSSAAFLILIFAKKWRKQFLKVLKRNKIKVLALNLTNEATYLIGKVSLNFASLLAPVALVSVVGGVQPFFIFIIGLILTLFFPKIITEKINKKILIQKIIAIIIMFVGIYLLYR